MKELTRFLAYTVATIAVILFVIFVARIDDGSTNLLPYTAILLVIVMPIVIGVFMGRREKSRRDAEAEAQRRRIEGGK